MDEIQAILDRIGTDTPPTADELNSAVTSLKQLMRDERANPQADLEVLQSYKAAYDTIKAAHAEAAEAEAAIQAEVDELLADVFDDAEGGDEEDGDDEPAEAENSDKEPVLAGGQVKVLSMAEVAARVRSRPQPPEPAAVELSTNLRTLVNGREVTKQPTLTDLKGEFAKFTRNPALGKHAIARWETLDPTKEFFLSDDIGKRTAQIDALVSPEAVAAAGGCCILPEPIRDQTVLGSTARPIRDSLPSRGIQSVGAVTFYPPVCIPQEGAAVWTCDDDAAVDPEDLDTWKSCAVFECDEPVVTTVDAIYRCITIGNFQRAFDSERWGAVLQALLISEARLAETHLWTKMRAATLATKIGNDTGSIFVTFIQNIGILSEMLRQDQRLADINLHYWGPEWLKEAMRADLVARRIVHVENPVAADTLINQALSNSGVNVTWSPDLDTIDSTPNAGPVPTYPAIASGILAPEGYFTYLDAGQFDLGTEIRDFNLTRQNAVAAFAEEFQGLMARGCAALNVDLPVTVCDLADGCIPVS